MANNKYLYETPSSIDIIYLLGLIVAFITFSFIKFPVLYIIYPIILLSFYQDWRSARIAITRNHWYFLISDLITVFNYISLFIAICTVSNSPLFNHSEKIWLHWGGIFLIYMIWNLVMATLKDTEPATRKFFIKYTLVEMPILLYCFSIFILLKLEFPPFIKLITQNTNLGNILLIFMACFHLLILGNWIIQTYISKSKG